MLLVNAQHIKAVPGRKTDLQDGEWIAQNSGARFTAREFCTSSEQRELRDLSRYRTTLVEEHSGLVNRIQNH